MTDEPAPITLSDKLKLIADHWHPRIVARVDGYNVKLTRARAASVMNALIERGVIKSRLRSAGYGERCPVDPGHDPKAWEKNRRVEFKIIETDAGPTGVEVTCPRGRSLVPR